MKIKEIIVVEGKDDTVAVKRAVDADTIETNGSAVSESTLRKIELAEERRGVIVFTDPDYPGERIRKIVSGRVPTCKHAFLPKKEAISKNQNDLGVENATPEAIREALLHAKQETTEFNEVVTWQDLHAAGLIAGVHAKKRRERLGELLRIGYANGKQLHKRLHTFRITAEEFGAAMQRVFEEETN
ncbi:ribonuclease M5 [Halalkalibacter akibai]|uniref:Ribonuclease M5 n=1 Tax=Halalkalibacter akibai (strain ATCC 43226 / DSM 21942 / CIP 109018 / JCM 9157 / 1139) TaxID=1236973 RepID=W4QXD1_HALA3|nr:ribonuclease M5 [Halalkalibacter akibai]GAE36557.1 ribonuclease M5 [Halalkalibacter akibai JCM 9157]